MFSGLSIAPVNTNLCPPGSEMRLGNKLTSTPLEINVILLSSSKDSICRLSSAVVTTMSVNLAQYCSS